MDVVRVRLSRRVEEELARPRLAHGGTDALVEGTIEDEAEIRSRVHVGMKPFGRAVEGLGERESGHDSVAARFPEAAIGPEFERHAQPSPALRPASRGRFG